MDLSCNPNNILLHHTLCVVFAWEPNTFKFDTKITSILAIHMCISIIRMPVQYIVEMLFQCRTWIKYTVRKDLRFGHPGRSYLNTLSATKKTLPCRFRHSLHEAYWPDYLFGKHYK